MARPKSNKTTVSISFDNSVLEGLEFFCKKERTNKSVLVNSIVKKVVLSEYDFYRSRVKYYCSKMNACKILMDSSPDRPDKKNGGEN